MTRTTSRASNEKPSCSVGVDRELDFLIVVRRRGEGCGRANGPFAERQGRLQRCSTQQIAPQKSYSEYKPTDARVSNGIDPRCVIKLTHLNRIRNAQRNTCSSC